MGNYIDAKEELLEEMEANEGATIMEDMIKERRDWVTEFRRKNLGKFPDNLDAFHKRFDVETPEEIAAREAAAEADDGKKPKKKEKLALSNWSVESARPGGQKRDQGKP